ncbi:DUF2318 domain-containing protein [Nitratidesulfovibrio liaohensis]|uniref:DUF2318 domain-containing protein n=1 Tax=Nitratidesulfovibrio liaohensis TaxID=2604158 RepID=UPI0014208E1D|nr:DUF2318 domain-containing protein [Nitratidesulfovibrio liaohensis]NHZ46593.1 DUF2318 domain-containing protein [Nitratidesulfovibrio liaohensis]
MKFFRQILPATLVVLALLAQLVLSGAAHAFFGFGGKYETLQPQGETIRIKAADITPTAKFYAIRDGGTEIRFFVVKGPDGTPRAALDACDVCWREGKGYRQEGPNMVCENCGMVFNTARINEVRGGCNPHPLERTMDGGDLLLRVAELKAGARYFATAK